MCRLNEVSLIRRAGDTPTRLSADGREGKVGPPQREGPGHFLEGSTTHLLPPRKGASTQGGRCWSCSVLLALALTLGVRPPSLDLRAVCSPGPSDGAQESSHLSLRKEAAGRGSFVTHQSLDQTVSRAPGTWQVALARPGWGVPGSMRLGVGSAPAAATRLSPSWGGGG